MSTEEWIKEGQGWFRASDLSTVYFVRWDPLAPEKGTTWIAYDEKGPRGRTGRDTDPERWIRAGFTYYPYNPFGVQVVFEPEG